ncbi:MAG: 50S ribosomal protein L23 [Acidobacteria bacterium]|nr:MAG: 50S ribosomal protein L23 [Acidobacteriota bacterium]
MSTTTSTEIFEILRAPHVTEKSTTNKEATDGRVVAFKVKLKANKVQIKEAVEKLFNVKVESVRTATYHGKWKRQGKSRGRRSDWKKAYVTLKPGQKPIEFFETT